MEKLFVFTFFACLVLIGCERDENALLNALFTGAKFSHENSAPRTFVIWVNGDADHYVSETSTHSDKGLMRADAVEVARAREYATHCSECNVVLLHVQRGGSHWYTMDEPWATFLRVYIRGSKVLERKVPILNSANPELIGRLLKFSTELFGEKNLHFIYRGHSFFPDYDPKTAANNGITPFAYGFPEFPFGIAEFAQGLKMANLSQPLESIVLAACSMANVQTARAFAPYAKALVTSQIDILETISVSFDFAFLADPVLRTLEGGPALNAFVASSMVKRFDETQVLSESMMEYPMSVIDLPKFSVFDQNFSSLVQSILKENPQYFEMEKKNIIKESVVQKVVSSRYIDHLRAEGKTENYIQSMVEFVRVPADSPEWWDAGQFLGLLSSTRWASEAAQTHQLLSDSVQVTHSSEVSKKSGLTFLFSDYVAAQH